MDVMLNNGISMPLLGFGTFQITDPALCRDCVLQALKAGYRLIDTAACYGNEKAVGEALAESGVPRDEVFLVSKVWVQDAGEEKTIRSFEKTLENLKTEYLDLYLIHMPLGDYHGSWRAMETLYKKGKVRAIGVCNFQEDRLADLILSHTVSPAVNQIELHPFCQQRKLRDFMAQYDIHPMAWAPFAEGKRGLFTDPLLEQIGSAHGKSAAQAVLRWLIDQKITVIPKSVHGDRIRSNQEIWDFSLSEDEHRMIRSMDLGSSLILDIQSQEEVYRLHGISFEQ